MEKDESNFSNEQQKPTESTGDEKTRQNTLFNMSHTPTGGKKQSWFFSDVGRE